MSNIIVAYSSEEARRRVRLLLESGGWRCAACVSSGGEAIRAVRTRRAERNVPPSRKAKLTIATAEQETFTLGIPLFQRLASASEVEVTRVSGGLTDQAAAEQGMVCATTYGARIFMPLSDLVDLDKERARVEKELKKHRTELDKLNAKLNNPGFTGKAPANVVAAERERAEKLSALIQALEEQSRTLHD